MNNLLVLEDFSENLITLDGTIIYEVTIGYFTSKKGELKQVLMDRLFKLDIIKLLSMDYMNLCDQSKSISLYLFRIHDSEMSGIPFIVCLICVWSLYQNAFIFASNNSSNLESLKMCQEDYILMNNPNSVPIIKMSYEGKLYCGMLGSYCWNDICVDKGLPSKSDSAITIKEDRKLSFVVEGYGNADTVLISVLRGNEKLLEGHDYQILLNIGAGTYLIQVLGIWKGIGDVSYFFPIKIL